MDDSDVVRKFGLPDKLCIIFLPPNIKSRIQPTDMGIIAVLKVGYKLFMVRILLAVYEDQTFTEIYIARKRQKRGCKGMSFRGKAHIIDAPEILNHICSLDEKYAKKTSIKSCWKNLVS